MTLIKVDRIQIPSSTIGGEKPPRQLEHGELWVNTTDKLLYAGIDGSAPVVVSGTGGTTSAPGSFDAGTYV